jgi:uncharacterized protein (DUF433 family)
MPASLTDLEPELRNPLAPESWLAERARQALAMLRDTVEIDPDIMGGVPVLKGTRFPIPQLIAEIADGRSVDNLASTFSLDRNQIENFLHGLAIHLDHSAVK